jgi:GTPase
MRLIDEVNIEVRSGNGGNGCVSFRREKYVPFGGPNGGNGGRGGSVILEATRDKTSLLDFKFQPHYEGERGEHGMGSECDGRSGEDLVLKVPLGTLVYDGTTGELLYDLTRHEQRMVVAKGGRGGRGNKTFVSSTNRAPRYATPGKEGQEKSLRLELRLLADVGLVGLPNAGKSSFLRAVSRAKPTVADYPFTTLNPHLGVVEHKHQTIVIADLPGLIEGASEGAGLGHQFLRHVMRNRHLLHLADITADTETLLTDIATIEKELSEYDAKLAEIPRDLIFTKCDLLDAEALAAKQQELGEKGLSGFFISSHSHLGVDTLLDKLASLAPQWREQHVVTTDDGVEKPVTTSEVEEDRDSDTRVLVGELPDWAQGWESFTPKKD